MSASTAMCAPGRSRPTTCRCLGRSRSRRRRDRSATAIGGVMRDRAARCEVLRASIAELCAPDHRNDPEILMRWLANKTPENLKAWIADPSASLLLAVEDEAVLAVGSVRNDGEITLNYVSPQARFRGASTALLNAMETAPERGNPPAIWSRPKPRIASIGARLPISARRERFGTSSSFPMSKKIRSPDRDANELRSTLTCPACGHQATETMPIDACQFFYDCRACGTRLKPKAGDCCVFCSYGTVPCPPVQAGTSCCK